jgi:hypothetical protein
MLTMNPDPWGWDVLGIATKRKWLTTKSDPP